MKCWAIAVRDGGGVLGDAVNVLGDVMKNFGGLIDAVVSRLGPNSDIEECNRNRGFRVDS